MMNHKTISNGFQEANTRRRLSQRYPSPWEFLFNFNPFDNSEINSLQMTALKIVFFPTLQYATVGGASSKAGVLKRNLLAGLRGTEISLLETAKGERKVMSGHNLSPLKSNTSIRLLYGQEKNETYTQVNTCVNITSWRNHKTKFY